MDSPFSEEQEEKLSAFCGSLYDIQIWESLGKLGGQTMPDTVMFPDIAMGYIESRLSSAECIYLAGKRILEE
jgi:hypothetical protein